MWVAWCLWLSASARGHSLVLEGKMLGPVELEKDLSIFWILKTKPKGLFLRDGRARRGDVGQVLNEACPLVGGV